MRSRKAIGAPAPAKASAPSSSAQAAGPAAVDSKEARNAMDPHEREQLEDKEKKETHGQQVGAAHHDDHAAKAPEKSELMPVTAAAPSSRARPRFQLLFVFMLTLFCSVLSAYIARDTS